MPHGFFTVEQWISKDSKPHWKPVLHLDSYQSLSKAIDALEKSGKPGLFRVTQTQRCVWAQMENGKLRLHGSHVSSPEDLVKMTKIFEQEKGRRPVEKARQERARVKRSKLR
jgi:hypothetical protein